MSLLFRALAAAAIVGASGPALAHQDFAGDVHPRVDWAPARGRSKTVVLAPKTEWNTTLAIGVIGDVLLLAYHAPGPKGAEIKTLLRRLPL